MKMKRITLALSATALASVALFSTSGSAFAAQAEVTSAASAAQTKVTWKNAATGLWLGMDTGLFGTGTKVVTDNRNVGGWYETKNSDGSFTLRWAGYSQGDKCLDSDSDGNVYGIGCNGGKNQKWHEVKYSSGWRLTNKATGRVLDSNSSGSVYTSTDQGNFYQRWV
ncbi:RICIN domain-containing protein [Streptomyces sp. NBC_01481]|uniref:RICIN domain-containing protein n=1 Tax=Streptomyces sp. NBC_01481 TaxID=2975869 RepID=UPI002257322C|nr:RICIN domain-containing protein [Streptomyces sp. NBC_01481]MCX4586979.1 RICIN domain-containing protein [Streptomyces sp. NBC_01481]